MRIALLIGLVSCLVACGVVASAVEPTPSMPTPKPPIVEAPKLEPRPCALMSMRFLRPSLIPKMTKELALTDEQVAKITELLTRAKESMKPMIEEQRNATAAFANELANPNSSQATLVAAFEKAMKSESVLAGEMIKTLCAVRELLTDSQKENFAKFVQTQVNPWIREATDYIPKTPATPQPLPTPSTSEEVK